MQKDVELPAGANVRLDFSMRVGGLAEQVDVAARASDARVSNRHTIEPDRRPARPDLPMNGRNVVALAGTYAGVTAIRASQDASNGPQGPIMSVNGGNVNHNLFTLNGAVFTHFNQTTGFNPPPPDGGPGNPHPDAQLFCGIPPHRRQPGQHRVEGGDRNDFHGTAWEFHRNSELNARSFSSRRGSPSRSRIRPAPAAAARSFEQTVLVRLLPAAVGPRRGGREIRPSCRPPRSAPEI